MGRLPVYVCDFLIVKAQLHRCFALYEHVGSPLGGLQAMVTLPSATNEAITQNTTVLRYTMTATATAGR